MVARLFNRKVARFSTLPLVIGFEAYAGCNLSCKMCGYSKTAANRPFEKHIRLDAERFSTFLDAVSDRPRTLCLSGRGEPLLHPGLEDLIADASRRGHRVGFYCNGTLMDEARAKSLLGAGLAWVFFSVDGATPATFEAIRVGAKLAEVRENVLAFARLAKREFGGRCQTMINCTLSRETEPEKAAIIRDWEGMGVPVRFTPLVDWYGGEGFAIPAEMAAHNLSPAREKRYPCNILWTRMTFDVQGNYECCYRPRPMDGIPSIFDEPLEVVWRDRIGQLRERHLEGRIDSEPCASCPWWADRAAHISLFDRARMRLVNSGAIRMDTVLRMWNRATGHRPIGVT